MSTTPMNTLSPEDRLRIEDAAKQFWKRLIGIARHELDQRVAGRVGASDVVQSALESLWKAADHGKLVAHDTEDCWGLLCMIDTTVENGAMCGGRLH